MEEGRLLEGDSGVGGFCLAGEVDGRTGFASSFAGGWTAPFSPLALAEGVAGFEFGGPPAGVCGRGVSGGAGILVPSVSEKLTGLIDSSSNLLGMTATTSCNRRGWNNGNSNDALHGSQANEYAARDEKR